ncbi:unnamed protein product [Caenorhabditis sp. 36 PRJEB53466]|nr:unnamed protein product [Caenorhabditis sp. 36 PRJEB53466]
MRKLIIFFTLLSISLSDKLSASLDEKRAEICGRPLKPHKAPWAVRVIDNVNVYYSAILISQRHVITVPYQVMHSKNGTQNKIWIWSDGKEVNFEKCKDNVMELPKAMLKRLVGSLSTCKDPDVCGTSIERKIRAGWYIGSCEPGLHPFGFLLLEMTSNVADDPYFVPACLPADKTVPSESGTAELHATADPTDGHKPALIKAVPVKLIKCPHWKFDSQICANVTVCNGDPGGGIVKKIDGADTVIGILLDHPGECKADTAGIVSMAYFKDKLCELAGICKAKINVESNGGGSTIKVPLISVIALMMMF